MEDPHLSDASMRIFKLLMANTTKHNTRICQLDVILTFLQARMRCRIFINLPEVYDAVFPEFKESSGNPVLLVRSMHRMTPAGKYWYEESMD
jgi:hypothetical protein